MAVQQLEKHEGRSTKEEIFTALQEKEFEGQTVCSKLVGDFVIADKDTQIIIGSESKPGKMLIGYYFAEENYYQIIAVCHSDKADTYLKYMEDWITSFKLTD